MNLATALARMLPASRPPRTLTERAGGPSTVRAPLPVSPRIRPPGTPKGTVTPAMLDAILDDAWRAWGAAHGHTAAEVRRRCAFVVRAIQRRAKR